MSTRYVRGPQGETLTVADLPSPKVRRWVPRRKAEIVCAVQGGLLTAAVVKDQYGVSTDELAEWTSLYNDFGVEGLRTTRVQNYR